MPRDALLSSMWQTSPRPKPPLESAALRDRTPILSESFATGRLYRMRSTVAAHAGRVLHDRDRVDQFVLMASELVVNAILHGGGSGWLRMWLTGTAVYAQVTDRGPGMADPENAGKTKPDAGQACNRGLWIVRTLADHVEIESGPGGTSVTVRLDAAVDAAVDPA
jgi:anti-sigma regulatory factor (Ser/Thr protein kinase)